MTEIVRFPLAHSVRYVARDLPEVPNQYGPGVLAPSEITLTYRATPDSQLGRVHAYVAGRLWVDGVETPLLPGGLYGQHYFDGLDGWPEWLAEEARLHDPEAPAAVSAPVADRAAGDGCTCGGPQHETTLPSGTTYEEHRVGCALMQDDEAAADRAAEEHQALKRAHVALAEQASRDQTAVARVRQMADAWEQRLPDTILTATAVEAIRHALEATPVHVPVPVKTLERLVRVAMWVSRGRSAAFTPDSGTGQYVYPDATARFALGALDDAGLLQQFRRQDTEAPTPPADEPPE